MHDPSGTQTTPSPGGTEPTGHHWVWYRLGLLVALVFVFASQKFVEIRSVLRVRGLFEISNEGWTKLALGACVSVLLFAVLAEFASTAVARRVRRVLARPAGLRATPRPLRWYRFGFFVVAGVFLFANLQSRLISAYIPAVDASPPLGVAVAWVAAWAVFAVASLWARPDSRIDVAGFVGLILLTRVYAYWYLPFADIGGDMLSTIHRSQELLLRGQFPYIDEPRPAMPYWPGTFLLYTPAELVGADYRAMNLIVEVATVLVAGLVGAGGRRGSGTAAVARMALPLIMLAPNWTFYSAETQYPVSVFLAVLFCRSLTSFGGTAQAVTLGAAVAVNQTFGVFGLFVLPYWVRQFGLRGGVRLTGLSLLTCAVAVGPFVVWDAGEFFRVTILSLEPFSTDQLAGRFSLRPVVQHLFPHATEVVLAIVVVGVVAVNSSRRITAAGAAAVVALGYCLVLLLLHRTFSHYYLPVVAMLVSVPYRGEPWPGNPAHAGGPPPAGR